MSKDYDIEKIKEAIDSGRGIVTDIAQSLKISRTTFYMWLEANEELKEYMRQAKEKMIDIAESRFFDKLDRGEEWAVKMALKTIGKDRGYVETVETKDVSDKPRVIQVLNKEDIKNEGALE